MILLNEKIRKWAIEEKDIEAVALVGSYARNEHTETSDIDLVIVTSNPRKYLDDVSWTNNFGVTDKKIFEDWGLVKVVRVFYKNGVEVEFGLTTPEWTRNDPVDPGTKRVVNDGMKILVDKNGLLGRLAEGV